MHTRLTLFGLVLVTACPSQSTTRTGTDAGEPGGTAPCDGLTAANITERRVPFAGTLTVLVVNAADQPQAGVHVKVRGVAGYLEQITGPNGCLTFEDVASPPEVHVFPDGQAPRSRSGLNFNLQATRVSSGMAPVEPGVVRGTINNLSALANADQTYARWALVSQVAADKWWRGVEQDSWPDAMDYSTDMVVVGAGLAHSEFLLKTDPAGHAGVFVLAGLTNVQNHTIQTSHFAYLPDVAPASGQTEQITVDLVAIDATLALFMAGHPVLLAAGAQYGVRLPDGGELALGGVFQFAPSVTVAVPALAMFPEGSRYYGDAHSYDTEKETHAFATGGSGETLGFSSWLATPTAITLDERTLSVDTAPDATMCEVQLYDGATTLWRHLTYLDALGQHHFPEVPQGLFDPFSATFGVASYCYRLADPDAYLQQGDFTSVDAWTGFYTRITP